MEKEHLEASNASECTRLRKQIQVLEEDLRKHDASLKQKFEDKYKARIDQLESEKGRLLEEVHQQTKRADDIQVFAQAETFERTDDLRKEVSTLRLQMSARSKRYKDAQQRLAQLKEDMENQKASFEQRLNNLRILKNTEIEKLKADLHNAIQEKDELVETYKTDRKLQYEIHALQRKLDSAQTLQQKLRDELVESSLREEELIRQLHA